MKNWQLYKLMDLIEEIKKVDAMLKLHSSLDDSDFMLSQYQARKDKLISYLIDDLVSSTVISSRSFFTIKLLLDKFYPNLSKDTGKEEFNSEDLSTLESKICQM
ncbi:hypothetical protein [Adhaeribacter rhizoryzae]|uniref:Uncharacterized protein n=1 Tax=Adhaeribacter rhizoryzae TaxID=2607907 RepID=A0A5M6DMF5_9BACT|nr:hypothetical protein [Adhaeribacter rhizoryzae]KAA5548727.1 hypothetical protein F0145_04210 [Adhaeribacter rhizoryzae]